MHQHEALWLKHCAIGRVLLLLFYITHYLLHACFPTVAVFEVGVVAYMTLNSDDATLLFFLDVDYSE